MILWFALAGMTGLAVLAALWPLAFRQPTPVDEGREAEFYRAQLAEIERDVERGQLPRDEAAAARAEAARRLIAVGAKAPAAPIGADVGRRRAASAFILVAVPLIGLGLYGAFGAPQFPDAPLASRKPDANPRDDLEAAIAKIEAHLARNPQDAKGWSVLAPVYMRLGRFEDAAGAYRRLLALDADKGPIHAGLGEALVASADGVVTAEARAAFEQALKETPDLPMAKFYLALAREQDGDVKGAQAAYEALAPEAGGREPWMVGLRARLAALKGEAPPPEIGSAPPPQEDKGFSPEQREMIQGMVARLADRLASNGGSAEEWARLIRAYSVLKNMDKAKDALASARKALGSNAEIDSLARELGL